MREVEELLTHACPPAARCAPRAEGHGKDFLSTALITKRGKFNQIACTVFSKPSFNATVGSHPKIFFARVPSA